MNRTVMPVPVTEQLHSYKLIFERAYSHELSEVLTRLLNAHKVKENSFNIYIGC